MKVYPFTIEPHADGEYARFPFMFDGSPWSDPESDGLSFSCALSLRGFGDLGFDSAGASPLRPAFFHALGVDPGRVAARRQPHSKDVEVVDRVPVPSFRDFPEGDGFASRERGVYLSVTVADCLPVYLLDTRTRAFAVLHSGWKGTGIARVALDLMRDRWGTDSGNVAAVLGPCIRGCCYAVDEARAEAFRGEFDSGRAPFPLGPSVRSEGGRHFIDLQAANARLLEAAGVRNLAVCQNCTFDDERLGSYRREGSGRFTRMVAVAGRFPVGA